MPRKPKIRAKKSDPRYRGLKPWKKGQSGNPKGRPKGSRNRISHRTAMDELVRIMNSKRSPAPLKVKVAKIILDLSLQVAGLAE